MNNQIYKQTILMKLIVFFFVLSSMSTAYANQEIYSDTETTCFIFFCTVEEREEPSDGEVILGIALIVGLTYMYYEMETEDPLVVSRKLNDFKHGRGLRLTAYDNDISISILALERQHSFLNYENGNSGAFSAYSHEKPVTMSLIKVSYDW